MPATSSPTPPHHAGRTRRDDGAAFIEFAFVGVMFAVILFGIINMGILLSFKQNLTQAASEAARASVAAIDDPATTGVDERYDVVDAALDDVLSDFNRTCGQPGAGTATDPAVAANGVTCLRKIHDCPDADGTAFAAIDEDLATQDACMTVRLEFDNTGESRIMPAFPIISELEPDTMSSQTTVRLIPVAPVTTTTTSTP